MTLISLKSADQAWHVHVSHKRMRLHHGIARMSETLVCAYGQMA
jgi:hypothetical protein